MTLRLQADAQRAFDATDAETRAEATGPLELLSAGFEITWFQVTAPGQWLAVTKPDERTRSSFGLNHDYLVIGSASTVEFQQRMLAQDIPPAAAARVDPDVRFVVSFDPVADAGCAVWGSAKRVGIVLIKVGLPTSALPEDAVVQLHAILHSYLWRRDFFDEPEPVRLPTDFFDRLADIGEVMRRAAMGSFVAVFGLRKIGQSSFLRRLQDVFEEDATSVSAVALLSGNSRRFKNGRWWTAAQEMLSLWQARLHSIAAAAGSKIKPQAVQLQDLVSKKVLDTVRLVAAFEKDIGTLVKGAEALRVALSRDATRLVAIVDECDHLYPHLAESGHWRADFFTLWNAFRDIKKRLDDQNQLVAVFGGVDPSGIASGSLLNQPNPLFETPRIYLGALERADTGALLRGIGARMGLSFEEGAIDLIFELIGGYPLLLRRFGTALHQAESQRVGIKTISAEVVSHVFRKNKRDLYNQMIWILDHLRSVAPDEERLLRDLALGGGQAYDMWKNNDLREDFAANLERYGLVRFENNLPVVRLGLIKAAIQKPAVNEFDEQKRQMKGLVDALEAALRARLASDCAKDKGGSDAIHSVVNAIPSDAKNRPLARQELINLGELAGLSAVLEAMNWGDYEILLNKFHDVIDWCGPAVAKEARLATIKKTFLEAHLVRHNNDRELREMIVKEGFAAVFSRFCSVRDMFAAA